MYNQDPFVSYPRNSIIFPNHPFTKLEEIEVIQDLVVCVSVARYLLGDAWTSLDNDWWRGKGEGTQGSFSDILTGQTFKNNNKKRVFFYSSSACCRSLVFPRIWIENYGSTQDGGQSSLHRLDVIYLFFTPLPFFFFCLFGTAYRRIVGTSLSAKPGNSPSYKQSSFRQ